MLRIITDFDGPIMDVSERYYQVYKFCLEQTRHANQQVRQLSKPEFWHCKRARIPEQQIAIDSGLDALQADKFAQLRRQTVHTLPYLTYDQPVPGAVEALSTLKRAGFDLVVMTMRRVRELNEALIRCDLGQFFDPDRRYCLSNDYVKTGDTKDKPLLMARALAKLPPAYDVWMVGDTEADMIAAQTHGIKTMGVLSGIRDRTQLNLYKPDVIFNNLSEVVDSVINQALSPVR
ncbi:MAG: HAD family hydrolase [Symploca sp. SIO3C6]|uniref:HAD family hydrolase n=1 Tax=Symploca sp. SIO1C4 TaxID=2607765 RepID=A0A6B3NC10_9CYAN|nr:HAD family hydrolase [Symploca sp. SIO3C6]NER27171.1 HAD family hydrolase [Symploca sp. SIO1C4]NET06645.1 HAD family hydrolase [Symploca sp. SIO2B6]NET49539.1 HAD family hydrolase [Merismopedia sp. SIO2A8]